MGNGVKTGVATEPERCCDIVMKGGITSGILYPPAIVRIARSFHLVGIGGTSAGAIAAVVAAAAEYRRRHGGGFAGYDELENLPWDLAGEGRLTGLFRPDASTRELFEFALSLQGLEDAGWLRRAKIKSQAAAKLLRIEKTLAPVIDNGYGICTGMANGNPPKSDEIAPISRWLADVIDRVAGRDVTGDPLTFGDLRTAPLPPGAVGEAMAGHDGHSIDLRAVTTCVTFGRPYMLPFEKRTFAFDPEEWRRIFPRRVVDYLVRKAKERLAEKPSTSGLDRDGKLPLPVGDDLPVLVAARMSLSFPVLFTLVPLWAVDFEQKEDADGLHPLRQVFFSDGGITSNLPIQAFDSPAPAWPTLAINLQYTGEDGKPARDDVDEDLLFMTSRLSEGRNDLWKALGGSGSVSRLVSFAMNIFRSAQIWHDYSFLRLPGYTDRAVEIWLTPDEGGLNLNMPRAVIETLIDRGRKAGERLCRRFLPRDEGADGTPDDPITWDVHRWGRLRAALDSLADLAIELETCVSSPMPTDASLLGFFAEGASPPAYKFSSDDRRQEAADALDRLLAFARSLPTPLLKNDEHVFEPSSPRPKATYGAKPPM